MTNLDEACINAACAILSKSIQETQLKIAMDTIRNAGMYEEFMKFYLKNRKKHIFDSLKDFGKLHPDKFYVSEDFNQYDTYIIIN